MNDTTVLYALNKVPHVGHRMLEQLLEVFGRPQSILSASASELMEAAPRMSAETAEALLDTDLEEAEAEVAELMAEGVTVVSWQDAGYPANLRGAPDCPAAITIKGKVTKADADSGAIVGATHPTVPGGSLAAQLARGLGWRGLTIVSGLAEGVDTAAHFGALEVGARTIAALGSGLHQIFPRRNHKLAEDITQLGALVSELPPDMRASSQRLMARNRITSGLAKATIVVESETDSGSLATAERAWRQGRLVYAVDSGKRGNAQLLAQGARRIPPGEDVDFKALAEEIQNCEVPGEPKDDGQLKFDF